MMGRKSKTLRPVADHPGGARVSKQQGPGGERLRCSADIDAESVVTELATSVNDLDAAYRLVYQRYLREGYQEPTPGKLRFIAHCCLPESYTFVARMDGEIIATLSLIKDRELGLPLEKDYQEEIRTLRYQGRELSEVSCLATREGVSQSVVLQLIRTMYSYARYRVGVTDWVIAVNPKQRRFYTQGLLFESIGEERTYSACEGAPAIALITDITDWEERMAQVHGDGLLGRFFGRQAKLAPITRAFGLPGTRELDQRLEFAEQQMNKHGTDAAVKACIRATYAGCIKKQDAPLECMEQQAISTTISPQYRLMEFQGHFSRLSKSSHGGSCIL
jgi:hypothetical protein